MHANVTNFQGVQCAHVLICAGYMCALICDQFSGVCTCEVERDESRGGIPLIPLQLGDKLGCSALRWIIMLIVFIITILGISLRHSIINKLITHIASPVGLYDACISNCWVAGAEGEACST